jgi:hypothetical protein
MKTVPVQEYADSARQRQGPGSDRAMPQTQEKAFSIDTKSSFVISYCVMMRPCFDNALTLLVLYLTHNCCCWCFFSK